MSRSRTFLAGFAAVLIACAYCREARADDSDDVGEHAPAEPTKVWLYSEGAEDLKLGQSSAVSTFTFTDDPTGALRPLASNVGIAGALYEVRARAGLGHDISFELTGDKQDVFTNGAPSSFSAGLSLVAVATTGTHLSLAMGMLRELRGSMGAFANAAFTGEVGGVRVLGNLRMEHVVAPGRDPLDVMVTAGANFRIAGPLRAGVEYVAQDIEAAFADDGNDAEGGMRHLVGPTLGVEIPGSRLSITGGPAFGLSASSPSTVARAALACSF